MARWELIRIDEQVKNKRRTAVVNYRIKHDGANVCQLKGILAETRRPVDNSASENNRWVGAGKYDLYTQVG